jgi:hypothetical protein
MTALEPSYDEDLCSDAAIADPCTHHRAPRDLGPAVWLRLACSSRGLELRSVVVALARRVARIELGDPVIEMSNALRGLERLPARLVPA